MKKILAFLFLLIIAGASYEGYRFFVYQAPHAARVELKPGQTLRSISQELEKKDLITRAFLFEALVRVQGKNSHLRSGEYRFGQGIRAIQILDRMLKGVVKVMSLTVPEGYNLRDMGDLIERKGLGTRSEWLSLTQDSQLMQKYAVSGSSLEGYLFPDTYFVSPKSSPQKIIEKMAQTFKKKITPEDLEKAKQRGFNLHQWVTLASIIEKETGKASERPLIASVFMNRLKKGMLLQTDPTVIYGIKDFDGDLTRKHLQTDHPYNTYTRPGLPPGPICSPGLASLKAVIHPAESKYYYFVGKGDGSHYFSKTLKEHNQAVRYYQLGRGTPPPNH